MNDWSLTQVNLKVPSGIVKDNANKLDDASAFAQTTGMLDFVNKVIVCVIALRSSARKRYFTLYPNMIRVAMIRAFKMIWDSLS
jgi:hypothetical protein